MEVEAAQYQDEDSVDWLVSMIGDKRTVKTLIGVVPTRDGTRGMQYALTLKTVSDRYVLVVGDWLVINPHGGIEVWTNEAFEERFIV